MLALVSKAPDGSEKILSSCGLTERPSIIKVKGKAPVETRSHSIVGVVTDPEARGKGYASILIKDAVKVIDELQAKYEQASSVPFNFSNLYSDVGEYYAKFDYKAIPTDEFLVEFPPSSKPETFDPPAGFKWLTATDFDNIEQIDKAQVLEDINELTENDGITRVAISPCADFSDLFYTQASHAAFLSDRSKFPKVHSASRPDDAPVTVEDLQEIFKKVTPGATYGPVTFVWFQDFKKNRASVWRILLDEKSRQIAKKGTKEEVSKLKTDVLDAFGVLLKAFIADGQSWKLNSATIWNADIPEVGNLKISLQEVVDIWNKNGSEVTAVNTVRKLNLPMIRFTNGQKPENVEWFTPGQYAWN